MRTGWRSVAHTGGGGACMGGAGVQMAGSGRTSVVAGLGDPRVLFLAMSAGAVQMEWENWREGGTWEIDGA